MQLQCTTYLSISLRLLAESAVMYDIGPVARTDPSTSTAIARENIGAMARARPRARYMFSYDIARPAIAPLPRPQRTGASMPIGERSHMRVEIVDDAAAINIICATLLYDIRADKQVAVTAWLCCRNSKFRQSVIGARIQPSTMRLVGQRAGRPANCGDGGGHWRCERLSW